MNMGTFLSSLPFASQLHKKCSLLQSSLKYPGQKKTYVGLGRKVNIWPITLSPVLAEDDLLQSFLPGIFSECEDINNMEKIFYFIFKPRPFFFLFIRASQARAGDRMALSSKEQVPIC